MEILTINTEEGQVVELTPTDDGVIVSVSYTEAMLKPSVVKAVVRFLVDYLASLEAGGLKVWE